MHSLSYTIFILETTGNSKNVLQKVLEHTSYGHHLLQLSPRSLKAYLRDLVYIEYDVNEEEHEVIISLDFDIDSELCTYIKMHSCLLSCTKEDGITI